MKTIITLSVLDTTHTFPEYVKILFNTVIQLSINFTANISLYMYI